MPNERKNQLKAPEGGTRSHTKFVQFHTSRDVVALLYMHHINFVLRVRTRVTVFVIINM